MAGDREPPVVVPSLVGAVLMSWGWRPPAKLREAGFVIDGVTEQISDSRETMKRWLDAWTLHRDAIAAEQGEEQTDHHIVHFQHYLRMIDEGKASNHFIISTRPAR